MNGTTIYAEKLYKINFTEQNKKFCITLEQTVIYLLVAKKFINLKQKNLKL